MERVALFVIAGVFVTLGAGMLRPDADGSRPDALRSWASQVTAREAALTGEAVVRRQVLDSLEAGGFVGPLAVEGEVNGSTSFRAVARRSGDTIDIDVQGVSQGETHPRRHRYVVEGGTEPPVHRPSFLTDNNITLVNELEFTRGVPGLDADLHSNRYISISGGPLSVEGAANYVKKYDNMTSQPDTDMFRPTSGAPVRPVDYVPMPAFSAAALRTLADETHRGSYTLPPVVTLGTRENPKIIYVDGSVRTGGPVTVTGYGAIISTGSMFINHDVVTVRPDGAPVESSLGLFTDKNIEVTNSHLSLDAQMFTGSNFSAAPNTQVSGSVATLGNSTFNGKLSVEYVPRSPAIDALVWGDAVSSGSGGSGTGGGSTMRTVAVLEGTADL